MTWPARQGVRDVAIDLSEYSTLAAMISPALFLTATGSLIISTSNRMSRIVDRIRVLTELSDRIDRGDSDLDFPERRMQHATDQLERLVWRSDRVQRALSMLYASLASFVGTSLTLAIDVLFHHPFAAFPTILAVAGVAMMLVSSLELVREARTALKNNRLEVEFSHELREWRRRSRGGRARPGDDPGAPAATPAARPAG
jgi:hypothetical protein